MGTFIDVALFAGAALWKNASVYFARASIGTAQKWALNSNLTEKSPFEKLRESFFNGVFGSGSRSETRSLSNFKNREGKEVDCVDCLAVAQVCVFFFVFFFLCAEKLQTLCSNLTRAPFHSAVRVKISTVSCNSLALFWLLVGKWHLFVKTLCSRAAVKKKVLNF